MKRIKQILIGMVLMCAPFIVSAQYDAKLVCPTKAGNNTIVSCSITLNTDKITEVKGNYSFSKGISYNSFKESKGFELMSYNKSSFNMDSAGKSGNFVVGTLSAKLSGLGSQKISVTLQSANNKSTATAKINSLSSDNTLKKLAVKDLELSPSFNADKTSYTGETNKDEIIITANPTDDTSAVSGAGKKKLNNGDNTFKIKVISELGTSKTYTLKIKKSDSVRTANYLKSLSIKDVSISPKFDKKTVDYTAITDKDKIEIKAEIENPNAVFDKKFGPRTETLKNGDNDVLIKVKSKSGDIRTYTIKLTKGEESNTYLKTLTLSTNNLTLDPKVLEYNLIVPFKTKNITVNAEAEDKKATVKVRGEGELNVGENIITVTVKNDKSEKIYLINIIRQKEGETEMSSNNFLKSITIKGYKLTFKKDKSFYNLYTNEKALTIKADPEDKNAKVTIGDTTKLKDGSIIQITVVASDGSNRIYTITIKHKSNLPIFIGIIILLTLSFIGKVGYDKYKEKRKEPELLEL